MSSTVHSRRQVAVLLASVVCSALGLAARAATNVTFIHASDTHYIDGSNATQTAIVSTMNSIEGKTFPAGVGGGVISNVLGVTISGDCVNSGITAEWNKWKTDFGYDGTDGLLKYPVYEGWGNHDSGAIVPAAMAARNPDRPYVTNLSQDGRIANMHCSWDWGAVHVVDCNWFVGNANLSATHGSPTYDPVLSLDFLTADLAANVGSSGRPVIITQHLKSNTTSNEWWTDAQRLEFFNVIKNYNVVAILEGHEAGGHYVWTRDGGVHNIDVFSGNGFTGGYWVFNITDNKLITARTTTGTSWSTSFSKTITVPSLPAVASTWTASTHLIGGATPHTPWGYASNWSVAGGAPRMPGDQAIFGNSIGAASMNVWLNGGRPIGALSFTNSLGGSYTISQGTGEGTLTFDNLAAAALINVAAGTHTLAADLPLALASNLQVTTTGASRLNLLGSIMGGGKTLAKYGGGTLTLRGNNLTLGGTSVVAGVLELGHLNALGGGGLSVSAGASVVASAGIGDAAGKPMTFASLSLGAASGTLAIGTLDLQNNDAVITHGAGITDLRTTMLNGGITTNLPGRPTQAHLAALTGAAFTALSGQTTFDSQAVNSDDILIKYTWKGDANLDGKIDFNDYLAIDAGYLFGGSGYQRGDFDYSGSVTVADYVAIDASFVAQSGILEAQEIIDRHAAEFGSAYASALAAAVPEPATAGLLVLGVLPLMARRRNQRPPG